MNPPAQSRSLRPFLRKALQFVVFLLLMQWVVGNFVRDNGWQPILGMSFAIVATVVVALGAMGTAHYFDRSSPQPSPIDRS